MRTKLAATVVVTVVVTLTVTLGWLPVRSARAETAAAAATPEMCNGRSDPNLGITAQSGGAVGPALKYFLGISSDATGSATGRLVVGLPGSAQRLVVTDWCRVWQHQPGQPSNGSCGLTYPEGAITAHAVGTTELGGQDLLVRTDVRELASGSMLYRVRYRPLATETASDDCETGWTKLPGEGWYSLDSFHVGTGSRPAGYRFAGRDGGVFSFGAPFYGSMAGRALNARVVGITSDPVTGGYWLVAADGGVFSFNAPFYGPRHDLQLNRPVVAMTEDPPTDAYWLVASDGGVFAFGAAPYDGSMGGRTLNRAAVGMAADVATGGYWLVASDGGLFSFDAPFYGSAAGTHLNAPIVGMAATPSGRGYWLVAADGGVFAYGDAGYFGSRAGRPLSGAVVGMAATVGHGYWLVASDGGVFTYGDAGFSGSRASTPAQRSTVSMSPAT
jgi:hypothetical protein